MNHLSWKLEQTQTRWRIQASQTRFWVQQGLGLWTCCALVVLLLGCLSPVRRSMMVLWVWSSVTPLKTIAWHGARYDAREFAAWLSRTVYNGTPGEWFVWTLLVGSLPVVIAGLIGWWYLRRPTLDVRHIRGAELLTRAALQARMQHDGGPPGVEIAGVRIPEALHRTHMLVCGATGSGKSITIRGVVRQIMERAEPCILVDPEGELTQEFYSPERGDHLLNPLDARFPGWSPWAECETAEDRESQAASLFPLTPTMSETSTYYHRCARIIYRALLESLPQQDPQQMLALLADPEALCKCLAGTEAAGLLKGQLRFGMISTVQIACACFRALSVGQAGWSARGWIQNRRGWCFLTWREEDKESVLPLVSLWLDLLSQRLLSSALAPQETTWMVIDELAVLKVQPNLQQLLNRGRKRGVGVVLGFQDVLQLEALYGKAITANMLDQPTTQLLLRTGNGPTQQWCTDRIGRQEVERTMESETVGPENVRDSISRNPTRKEEPVVMGAEFGILPNLRGYLKVAHYGAARVDIPYVGMEARHPAFVAKGIPGRTPSVVSTRRRAV
jgi:hypothetical protein